MTTHLPVIDSQRAPRHLHALRRQVLQEVPRHRRARGLWRARPRGHADQRREPYVRWRWPPGDGPSTALEAQERTRFACFAVRPGSRPRRHRAHRG